MGLQCSFTGEHGEGKALSFPIPAFRIHLLRVQISKGDFSVAGVDLSCETDYN